MEFIPTEVILKRAKAAASCPALRDTEAKNRALAAMAQALETVWDHDAIRRHGRNFSLDAMADRYLTWYQSIVKE